MNIFQSYQDHANQTPKKKKKSGAQSPRKYSREWEGEKTTGNNFK